MNKNPEFGLFIAAGFSRCGHFAWPSGMHASCIATMQALAGQTTIEDPYLFHPGTNSRPVHFVIGALALVQALPLAHIQLVDRIHLDAGGCRHCWAPACSCIGDCSIADQDQLHRCHPKPPQICAGRLQAGDLGRDKGRLVRKCWLQSEGTVKSQAPDLSLAAGLRAPPQDQHCAAELIHNLTHELRRLQPLSQEARPQGCCCGRQAATRSLVAAHVPL